MNSIVSYIHNKLRYLTWENLKSFLQSKKTIFALLVAILVWQLKTMPDKITSSSLIRLLDSDKVKSIDIYGNEMTVNLSNNVTYSASYFTQSPDFLTKLQNKGISFTIWNKLEGLLVNPATRLFFTSAAVGASAVSVFVNSNVAKTPEKKSKQDAMREFIANENIMDDVNLIIDQLLNREIYLEQNLKLLKGALLVGEPGTGKTLLARCLASLSGINFIHASGSEFVEIYVGTGPSNVRKLFEKARKMSPCIVFIDELESCSFKRAKDDVRYADRAENYATLNQLLVEMDGLNKNEAIFVLGATNRVDLIDEALTRPGRFDMKIVLEKPNKQSIVKMLKFFLFRVKGIKLSKEEEIEIANIGIGLTGAEINGIVNIVYSKALYEKKEVTFEFLRNAFASEKMKKFGYN